MSVPVGFTLQPDEAFLDACTPVLEAADYFEVAPETMWRTDGEEALVPNGFHARFLTLGNALGKGYGHPTAEARDGAEQNRVLTGRPGEVTYSGKALAGLRALVKEPRHQGKTFLFWNTLSHARPEVAHDVSIPASLAWMFEGEPVA